MCGCGNQVCWKKSDGEKLVLRLLVWVEKIIFGWDGVIGPMWFEVTWDHPRAYVW